MRVRHAVLASFAALVAACSQPADPETRPSAGPDASAADGGSISQAITPAAVETAANTPAAGEQGGTNDWRKVVSAADASNLGRLDQAWRMARAEAEEKGFAAQVEALGPLVDPNAGHAGRLQPPPGDYRCRTIKIGSRDDVGLGYVDYPWFRCTVELSPGGDMVLTKVTGSQRTRGLLYPDADRRLVFVGAQALSAQETGYPRYGQMPERDQVGVFERVGAERWRLVIPWPRTEAKLEILELRR